MTHPLVTLDRARRLAAGSALDLDLPNLHPRCAAESDFAVLVSDYYKVFCESLARDIAFLAKVQRSRTVEDCRRLIYDLRTNQQHTDNPDVVTRVQVWRSRFGPSQAAADALAACLEGALAELALIALSVARSVDDAALWRDVISVDVGTVFVAVSADLGLRFSPGRQRFMVRQIEGRLKVDKAQGDRREIVADFCVQEILSDRQPLPMPYSDVLDALGLLGDRKASGVISLAHSILAISPGLSSAEFLLRIEETWRAALAS